MFLPSPSQEGGGSGATATANLLAYLDFGTTISEVFRVTDKDPYSSGTANDIAFKNTFVTGSSEYGEAILPNRSATSPVWVHYRAPFPSYGGSATDYPWIFAEYAVIGAYSDWLTADGQTDRAGKLRSNKPSKSCKSSWINSKDKKDRPNQF